MSDVLSSLTVRSVHERKRERERGRERAMNKPYFIMFM